MGTTINSDKDNYGGRKHAGVTVLTKATNSNVTSNDDELITGAT